MPHLTPKARLAILLDEGSTAVSSYAKMIGTPKTKMPRHYTTFFSAAVADDPSLVQELLTRYPETWATPDVFASDDEFLLEAFVALDCSRFLEFYIDNVFRFGEDEEDVLGQALTSAVDYATMSLLLTKYLDYPNAPATGMSFRTSFSSPDHASLGDLVHRSLLPNSAAFQGSAGETIDILLATHARLFEGPIFLRGLDLNSVFKAVVEAARKNLVYPLHDLLNGKFRHLLFMPTELTDGTISFVLDTSVASRGAPLRDRFCATVRQQSFWSRACFGEAFFTILDEIFDPQSDVYRDELRRLVLPKMDEIRMIVKDRTSLKRLEALGLLFPDYSFIPYLLTFPDGLRQNGTPAVDSFLRRQTFRSLAYVLGNGRDAPGGSRPPSAELFFALQVATLPFGGVLPGHSGIIRLLLLYGADANPQITQLLPKRLPSTNLPLQVIGYRHLHQDILQAIYWKRWSEEGLYAGLPAEILNDIMLRKWEEDSAEIPV